MRRWIIVLMLSYFGLQSVFASGPTPVHGWFAVQIQADTQVVNSEHIELQIHKVDQATDQLQIHTHETTQPLTVTLPNQQILIRQDYAWYANLVMQGNGMNNDTAYGITP